MTAFFLAAVARTAARAAGAFFAAAFVFAAVFFVAAFPGGLAERLPALATTFFRALTGAMLTAALRFVSTGTFTVGESSVPRS